VQRRIANPVEPNPKAGSEDERQRRPLQGTRAEKEGRISIVA
jgi:hypothetical protein